MIYLGFEQVPDGGDVVAAIAPFDKETLIVLILVGCAYHGIVAQFSVVIEHGHAAALFKIGRRYNLQIVAQVEPL